MVRFRRIRCSCPCIPGREGVPRRSVHSLQSLFRKWRCSSSSDEGGVGRGQEGGGVIGGGRCFLYLFLCVEEVREGVRERLLQLGEGEY